MKLLIGDREIANGLILIDFFFFRVLFEFSRLHRIDRTERSKARTMEMNSSSNVVVVVVVVVFVVVQLSRPRSTSVLDELCISREKI